MLASRLALLIAISLTGVQFYWMFGSFRNAVEIVDTKASLRRLATLTVQFFPEHNPTAEALWAKIGRSSPIRDFWGTEFLLERMEIKGHSVFLWRSAGPDRHWRTRDDLELLVPFPEGSGTDLGDEEPTGAPSLDAK